MIRAREKKIPQAGFLIIEFNKGKIFLPEQYIRVNNYYFLILSKYKLYLQCKSVYHFLSGL